ncbi:MAG: FGGY-family carbohydrate kinase [Microthrixaceae bacterium]|nr:FGGY-family carbohydrate kinase [Microthrixaceae bacterium]
MPILVIDLGTSSVRATVLDDRAGVIGERSRRTLPQTPAEGLVEFDATRYVSAALDCAREVLAQHGPVESVGVASQRATTIVWDRSSGEPVAPAQGWQDLRTVGDCLVLAAEGIRLAPNQSATKLANILDAVDPDRSRDLCFGTPDSWLIWKLTEGSSHVSDLSNAGIWGLLTPDGTGFDESVLERLRIPRGMLPRIVDSTGDVAEATALDGAPVIRGIAGDQQASLIGQGCVRPGEVKATFGTGGMLDVCLGPTRPEFDRRGGSGCFPLVAWRDASGITWGTEAVMLSAGTNVEWLVEDMGLIDSPAASEAMAQQVESTDGVTYVPALLGLGTPHWDYGARGAILGATRGTTAAHVVRAVLQGVAHRGADLLEAARDDSGLALDRLRIDGGMATNHLFAQLVADATGVPVEVSPLKEATTLGAGYLAGLATGAWAGWDDVAAAWSPAEVLEPSLTDSERSTERDRWAEAVRRAGHWHEDLSALDF